MKDFARVVTDDKKGEGMTNIFRESSKIAKTFRSSVNWLGFGRRVIMGVVHRLVETIIRDHADVRDLAVDHAEWRPTVEGRGGEPIENVGNICKAEVPHVRGGVGSVHRTVDGAFDILPVTFCMVLMLIVGFTLPIGNDKGT